MHKSGSYQIQAGYMLSSEYHHKQCPQETQQNSFNLMKNVSSLSTSSSSIVIVLNISLSFLANNLQ